MSTQNPKSSIKKFLNKNLSEKFFGNISNKFQLAQLPTKDERRELLNLVKLGKLTTEDMFKELQESQRNQILNQTLDRVKEDGFIRPIFIKENYTENLRLNVNCDTLKILRKSIIPKHNSNLSLSSAPNSPPIVTDTEDLILEEGLDNIYSSIQDSALASPNLGDRKRLDPGKMPVWITSQRNFVKSENSKRKRNPKTRSKFFCLPTSNRIDSSIYSDLSQSAPNSPFESDEDEGILNPILIYANTFNDNIQNNRHGYHQRDSNSSNETRRLMEILEKLNLQNHWKNLVDNGIKSIQELGKLTRIQLVQIGIEEAEDRASLMTAAQLLTDDRLMNILSNENKSDFGTVDSNNSENNSGSPYKIDSGYNTESSPNIQTLLPSTTSLAMRLSNAPITQSAKPPTGILRIPETNNAPNQLYNRTDTSRTRQQTPNRVNKTVKINEASLPKQTDYRRRLAQNLRNLLLDKLNEEEIFLENTPYSDINGNYGIPLPLVQRYSIELGLETEKIALALEEIRVTKLINLKRNYVSNKLEILNRTYLNCPFIKTNTILDLLTSIGLPMYAPRFNNKNLRPQDLKRFDRKLLIRKFQLSTFHADWLYRQMRMIPTVLWGSVSSHRARSGTMRK